MSKKNNLTTRQNAHKFALEREKAEREKREKKKEKVVTKAQKAPVEGKAIAKKSKFKGVRIKRNRTIRGIKIKDAESRQKVREVLAAEQAMKEMAVDEEPVVRRKSPAKKKKKAKRIPADAMQLD
ncbi:hypothetical protein ACKKBG_A33435 [Auxenochlorella protothecoides x Auxenochlorella symbiontica]|uniref:Uncharacterized protein n=1 Tax=Auxenochlorella protothecoides TaxID=3075 RepID=A0A087SJ42_AUXPR|nr:hypothetical protein F751_2588 [Auxenochlorella protothecoides]KFM25746.1 hypothetical protein F751_2588 [Auxenochlorella protothecoides]RMZ57321.1 hypothetical protein APUTEX25_004155 [Auxenochlorella protothecoides]|eukprot:RMZ57321.1 hypothetical protein APUTEX25_004155 [Auxenochlorella protothecoides]